MSTPKFQNRFRIPSARFEHHDYNGGLYFITICTKNREHFFGKIVNHEMRLSTIGNWAVENLENINHHYPYAEIPLFVVMPNHIHTIIVINDKPVDPVVSIEPVETTVETMCTSSLQISEINKISEINPNPGIPNNRWKNNTVNEKMQTISHKRGNLSVVVGGFKRAVTHFANQNYIEFGWQERFYDRIIRNQNECNRIAEYIVNNPQNWCEDEFNDGKDKITDGTIDVT